MEEDPLPFAASPENSGAGTMGWLFVALSAQSRPQVCLLMKNCEYRKVFWGSLWVDPET